MRLSPHFFLDEFTRSDTAERLGIDNKLPLSLYDEIESLAQTMERIRAALGNNVISVSSGYRSLPLNRALKSKDTSHHVKASACDFVCRGFGSPFEVCRHLEPLMSELGIGQLIHEITWVHIGILPVTPINRVLTQFRSGPPIVGIVKAR